MNHFQSNLYNNLFNLTQTTDAFYFTDHVVNNSTYRVFLYRLASYTEFMLPSALECRGHTFRMNGEQAAELVSMPMAKFFNLYENPATMNLNLSDIVSIADKLDGSLISTVKTESGFLLKSKGSLSSKQSVDAFALLQTPEYYELKDFCHSMVSAGYTVNMEYMAPDNVIVICYDKPTLKVLNVRSTIDGSYLPVNEWRISPQFCVNFHMIPADAETWVNGVYEMSGIEGFIVTLSDGTIFKIKTKSYSALHKTKDSINNPRSLWEVCVHEGADDIRALFHADALAVQRINEMEEKAAHVYNHIHQTVHAFFKENKDLDRKSYAILGQEKLNREGLFSLAMNLYLGKECDIKSFLVKNYKRYGVKDEYTTVE